MDKNNDNKVIYFADKKAVSGKKGKKFWLLAGLIIFLTLLLIYFVFFSSRPEIIEANYGEIVDGFKTEALLLRRERVFPAPVSGRVDFKVSEGERVSKGQEVVSVDEDKVYSRMAGIISFAEDGLEGVLHPQNIGQITLEIYDEIQRDFNQLSRGSRINEGEMLYRIIDNNQLYLVIPVKAEEGNRYRQGETVFVEHQFSEEMIEARVENILVKNNDALLTIRLNRFVDEWLNLRRVEVSFIKNIHRGIVIPQEAVFKQPDGQGLLVMSQGSDYSFREIEIVNQVDDKLIVDNLEIGDKIIVNPEVVDYGREG